MDTTNNNKRPATCADSQAPQWIAEILIGHKHSLNLFNTPYTAGNVGVRVGWLANIIFRTEIEMKEKAIAVVCLHPETLHPEHLAAARKLMPALDDFALKSLRKLANLMQEISNHQHR